LTASAVRTAFFLSYLCYFRDSVPLAVRSTLPWSSVVTVTVATVGLEFTCELSASYLDRPKTLIEGSRSGGHTI